MGGVKFTISVYAPDRSVRAFKYKLDNKNIQLPYTNLAK